MINLYSITTVQGAEVVNVKTVGATASDKEPSSQQQQITAHAAKPAVRRITLDRKDLAPDTGIGQVNAEIEQLIQKQKQEIRDDYANAQRHFSGARFLRDANAPTIAGGDVDDTLDCDVGDA